MGSERSGDLPKFIQLVSKGTQTPGQPCLTLIYYTWIPLWVHQSHLARPSTRLMSISKHQKRFSNLPNFLLHFRKPACWADVPNFRRTGWFPHYLLYWSVVCSISVLGSVQILTEEAMWTH